MQKTFYGFPEGTQGHAATYHFKASLPLLAHAPGQTATRHVPDDASGLALHACTSQQSVVLCNVIESQVPLSKLLGAAVR